MHLARFLDAIRARKISIGVIGLGYVGLPLAVLFAKKGFHVTGFLRDKKKIQAINRGKYNTDSVDATEFSSVVRDGNLVAATLDSALFKKQDIFLICVPTPVYADKRPDLSAIGDVAKRLSSASLNGKLIVNESTVAPGTTREIFGALGASYLACSPERVDPGNKEKTVRTVAKVVGAIDEKSLTLAKALYEEVLEAPVVPVSTLETAEMVKMLENTYRAVNIALVNEFARLAEATNLDIVEVIEAAKSKWSFHAHFPSLGVGGHCIPVDPWYLVELGKQKNVRLPLIETGLKENEAMTQLVAKRVVTLYKKGMRVLLYGITYKKDVKDIRESPVLRLAAMLKKQDVPFLVYDPLFSQKEIHALGFKSATLQKVDFFIVGTDHKRLAQDWPKVIAKHTVVVDGRNYFRKKVGKVVYGVGRTLV